MRKVLVTLAIIYVLIAAALFALQRKMLYFPTQTNPTPEEVGLSGVDVVPLQTSDGETLVLWYTPAPDGRPTVLYFHGNGGEIADRSDRFAAYQAAGLGVAFLSWRGYGGSTGSPSEAGFLIDGITAYNWLTSNGISSADLALVGESLGTGVAVQIAADRDIGVLSLGAPFTAAVDIAARRYPWLPVRLLMKDPFRSIDHIGQVRAPILIQHGTQDRVVPFDMGQTLAERASAPVTFSPISGEGHDMLYILASWHTEIEFINRALSP